MSEKRAVRRARQAGILRRAAPAFALAWLVAAGCAGPSPRPALPPAGPPPSSRELRVTATAFNSVPDQTDAHPALTASGETLRPGVRAIAVSPDLERAGLALGTRVEIEGLAGEWRILDRMPPRWRRRIDVYMGLDEAAARRFGKREVTIRWRPAP
jgi:3D (Asp-Asp-Asp) domain-containing protein